MDFPIADLMDEDACYAKLLKVLHPQGLACPRCHRADRITPHRRHRAPVLDYRCDSCRRVFNAFTGSALQGTKRRPGQLILILRGIAQGVPTAQLARELRCDRSELHKFRHRLQDHAHKNRDDEPLADEVLEADEADQNGGKKGSGISTPTTRRVAGPTSGAATAPGRMTGRRSAGWSAARVVRSA